MFTGRYIRTRNELTDNYWTTNHQLGNVKDAEDLYRRALDINIKQLGEDHPTVGETLNQLSIVFKLNGNYDEAVANASKVSRTNQL